MRKIRSQEILIRDIQNEYRLLLDQFKRITPSQQTVAGVCETWSAKDLLAHLVEWKLLFLKWYQDGLAGKSFKTPAEDLKWNQLPQLNERIYQKWKNTSLDLILTQLESTNREMLGITRSLPEQQLFQPKLYPWMNTSVLYHWIEANSSAHYHWARLLMRKWQNAQKSE
jgi:hypothetical protein